MSELKRFTLGEIAEITSSKRIFQSDYVTSGIPFFRSKEIIEKSKGNDISTELFITEEKFREIKSKFDVPKSGDILLTSVGTLGVSYQVLDNDKFYFKDGNLTWFKNFSKEIYPKFLLYWLKSIKGQDSLKKITIGSTQPALTIVGLKGIPISLPPLPTQKAIAEILSSLDDKIELNNQINQNLEALAQALFKQWFVDFEFPNENGDLYKSSGGEMIDSELGEIPKGWRIKLVNELNPKLETGKRPKGGVNGIDSGTPSVGAESIKGLGYFEYSKTKFVSKEFSSLMKKGWVNGFEILIYKDGGKPGTFIPNFNMFGEGFPFEKLVLNEHVFLLDFGSKDQNCFGYFFFDSDFVRPILANSGGKAAIPGINQGDINSLKIFDFEISEVKKFGEVSQSIISSILKNCKENENLRNLRDILLPKLISGELEVSEVSLESTL